MFLLPLPVRESSTCERSRRAVPPSPNGRKSHARERSLQFVEPSALSLVCVPFVRSPDIHLPGTLRSPGVTRLPRDDGPSDSCPAALRIHTAARIDHSTADSDDEHRSVPDRSLCFMNVVFQSFHLQSPWALPDRFRTLPLSVGNRRHSSRFGLRQLLAGSPRFRPNRVHSRCGLIVHLP